MTRICIFGESPLVEEYAALMLNRGCAVHGRLNEATRRPVQLPRGVRKVARAVRAVDAGLELTNTNGELKRKNLVELDRVLPPRIPLLSSAITVSLAEQAGWVQHPRRLVGLAALPSFLEGSLVELSVTGATDEKSAGAVIDLFRSLGKETAMVADTVGMVLPRIACMLANEAYFAMMEGVAPAREIDTAMKLGTNYPRGPVEWAGKIGLDQVQAVLAALHATFGEDRYRVAPLLLRSVHESPAGRQ